MLDTSLEQNTAQTSAYRNSHRYASDTPLIRECVTELLKAVCTSSDPVHPNGVPVRPRRICRNNQLLFRLLKVYDGRAPVVSRFVPVYPRCCLVLYTPPPPVSPGCIITFKTIVNAPRFTPVCQGSATVLSR